MADLLSPEERAALQESPAAGGGRPLVEPALFPSAGQLDPERTAALTSAFQRWLEPVAQDLSRQLRLPCALQAVQLDAGAGGIVPGAGEELFWAAVDTYRAAYLRIQLPRAFAASVCERIRGAPFMLREDRSLAASERMLLQELIDRWLELSVHVWPELALLPRTAPDLEATSETGMDGEWVQLSSTLACGAIEGSIGIRLAPLTTRVLLGEAAAAGADRCAPERVLARVGDVPVELRAVLGQAEFTLDELSSLRVGDVIALDRRAQDPVEIVLQERTVFRARAGLAGEWVAIELIDTPEEELHDEY